jgi:NAD(P)H dehydrogenase (quinone)
LTRRSPVRHSLGAIVVAFMSLICACSPEAPGESIIVSGASGQLGGLVVEELLGRGIPASKLILVSRSPASLEHYAEMGAQVRYGDFTEPDSLADAYAGGDRMLLISIGGGSGARPALHQAAIDAAVAAGVEHIAYTSFVNVDVNLESTIGPDHLATEQALRDSGIAWTMLRNQIYMNGLVDQAVQAIIDGQLITSMPETKVGYVTREDCAAAAAAVLATPGHEYKVYDITGPALVSPRDIAETAAAVSGYPVEYVDISQELHYARLIESGMSEEAANGVMSFELELASTYLSTTSSAVADLTGRPPTSIRQLFEANRERLVATGARRNTPPSSR